ncbi:MAG: hypothetical protein F4Y00_04805, partial [Bacteroidetes bacterium SB0662_bin_6]|nr:hypothetical protein [Bacteroidetes bacterium SB0668_bin_1]MYE04275.1 hypothetical protein [Bacteroidetes bacterium SB0662_bin_6]
MAIPEEGVRYSWQSVLNGGLDLLSASDELSPLFTSPVSGAGEEYTYRLTAMGAGVYRTATVTVTIQGASGDTVRGPGLQEECDPLAIPDEPGEGCAPWEREPDPFGFGFEEEGDFPFPEAAGIPDQADGLGRQAPPRLECPVAMFLEELETGQVECHAWDALGEENLEYSWEPVGNTTRDYLDNPRLIPEDSPTPLVIAPEAPAYETLESFLSGETTFRYRYRLTATSRATGLSSFSEVEVFVSSSRPGVYCPLEVVVKEGETVALDCEGVDPLSLRMDYDEDEASVLWEWEALWGTSMDPLAVADLSSPFFTAPPGSAGKEYHYIASMTTSASGAPRTARRRVTVKVKNKPRIGFYCAGFGLTKKYTYGGHKEGQSLAFDFCHASGAPAGSDYAYVWEAWEETPDTALDYLSATDILDPVFTAPHISASPIYFHYRITATAGNAEPGHLIVVFHVVRARAPEITCNDAEVYEATADFSLNCSATGAPSGATYSWAARSTSGTGLLTDTDSLRATFLVPDDIPGAYLDNDYKETHEYTVTMAVAGIDTASADVTVTVLEKPDIYCSEITAPPLTRVGYVFTEGQKNVRLRSSCGTSVKHYWVGAPAGSNYTFAWSPPDRLSSTTGWAPVFDVPENVDGDTRYTYLMRVSAENADGTSVWNHVLVQKRPLPRITVTCEDSPYEVDEGDADIELECEASGAPGTDPNYTWSWSPTVNLTDHDTDTPTFAVPGDVEQDTTYTYTATASAANAEDGTERIRVTVRDTDPSLTCTDSEVYEGSADFSLDCTVTNEPSGASYSWTGANITNRLIGGTDGLTPTFDVPDNVDATTDYKYTVTLSSSDFDEVTEDVTVTVLNRIGDSPPESGPVSPPESES